MRFGTWNAFTSACEPSSWAVTFFPNPLLPRRRRSPLSLSPRKSDSANHAALQAGLQDADPKDAHVLPPLRPHVVPPSEEGVQRLRLPVGAQQALQLGREDDSQEEPRHWPHALREGAAAPLQERLPREGEPPQTAIRTGACSRACQATQRSRSCSSKQLPFRRGSNGNGPPQLPDAWAQPLPTPCGERRACGPRPQPAPFPRNAASATGSLLLYLICVLRSSPSQTAAPPKKKAAAA